MKYLFTLFTILSLNLSLFALDPGDIMFVGYNADGADGFAFVALAPIPAGTQIVFTDAIGGSITWTSPGIETATGSVVNISPSTGTAAASIGTVIGTVNLNASNETLQAVESGGDCLAGIANESGIAFNTCTTLAAENVVLFTGDEDVMVYSASTVCDGTIAECKAMIADVSNWTTADDSGDQSASYTPPTSFSGSALPIVLSKFTLSLMDVNVDNSWTTSSEINNDFFTIQHSIDGKEYSDVGRVNGSGTTSVEKEYSFTHRDPVDGINYYRLKQTDFNGQYEIFPAKSIMYNRDLNKPSIFPTIATDIINVNFNKEVNSTYSILTVDGRLVESGSMTNQTETLDISSLPAGQYFIQIKNRGAINTERFIRK